VRHFGSPLHLIRRFVWTLRARPLNPGEQAVAAAVVRPGEREAFWSQGPADQRHAVETALRVMAAAPGRPDLARAALLHDVAKRHARLGPIGRSLATVAGVLRLPAGRRWSTYLDHGPVAADELAAAGAEPLVVAYARHHHRGRPDGVAEDDWRILTAADDV